MGGAQEDALIVEMRAADDERLVEMVRANYGPGGNAAIEAEMTRRLIVALKDSTRIATRASWALIVLTVVLVALTVVLIVRA